MHVAIIMDGNRRWAREHNLPIIEGYRRGVGALREAIAAAPALGVHVLTVFGFSSENWSREPHEVAMLMELCAFVARREAGPLRRRNVQVRIIGDVSAFPSGARSALQRLVDDTAKNTGVILNLALNYSGRREMCDVMRDIARAVAAGTLDPEAIDEDTIESRLWTAGLDDPDLLIRTGGEYRVSNFLLYQLAYTEFYVTPIYWPEFTRDTFALALSKFADRSRRFGA